MRTLSGGTGNSDIVVAEHPRYLDLGAAATGIYASCERTAFPGVD